MRPARALIDLEALRHNYRLAREISGARALAVVKALRTAKEMVEAGVKSTDRVVAEATHIITAKRRLRVIYIAVVDRRTMEPMREVVPGQCLMAVSYWVDEVRLTDNMPL